MRLLNYRITLARLAILAAMTWLFTVLLILGHHHIVPSAWQTSSRAWAGEAKKGVYTPAPGSAEQKAILKALGKKMESTTDLKMVFTVDSLKVHNGWAWIHALPKSPDGAQKYEDVNALLEKKAGCWQVAEIACTEEGNPDCLGSPDYFKKLRAKFPAAPADIFPDGAK